MKMKPAIVEALVHRLMCQQLYRFYIAFYKNAYSYCNPTIEHLRIFIKVKLKNLCKEADYFK